MTNLLVYFAEYNLCSTQSTALFHHAAISQAGALAVLVVASEGQVLYCDARHSQSLNARAMAWAVGLAEPTSKHALYLSTVV